MGPDYKDLGYANSWEKEPKEIIKCREQKHEVKSANIGRSLTVYICELCKYKYKVDSSD